MKKTILLLVALFSIIGTLRAQSLLIITEPEYRVYIDGDFKGFTTTEQDGIYIPEISVGEHFLDFKKGDFVASFDLTIVEGHNETEIELSTTAPKGFRTDGYYLAYYKKNTGGGSLLRGKVESDTYFLLYFGDDQSSTEEVEIKWISPRISQNSSRNNYTIEEQFQGLLKGRNIGDLPEKRTEEFLWEGSVNVASDGTFEGDLLMVSHYEYLDRPSIAHHWLHCFGSFEEDSDNFTLEFIVRDVNDPTRDEFEKEFLFEFKESN